MVKVWSGKRLTLRIFNMEKQSELLPPEAKEVGRKDLEVGENHVDEAFMQKWQADNKGNPLTSFISVESARPTK